MKRSHDTEYLIAMLQRFTSPLQSLCDDTLRTLANAGRIIQVPKGQAFCRQGTPYRNFVFVTKGIFRMYHIFGDIDKTLAFATEGDPFMSLSTYLTDQEAQFTLEALEDSEIYTIPNDTFRHICDTTDLNHWFRKALLGQIYALEQRYVWLGNLDAYSRYAKIIELRQNIINRIPLKYIASYLGITQETLSRIRARYARTSNNGIAD